METKKAGFILYGEKYDYYSASGILEYLFRKMGAKKIDFRQIQLPFLHPVNSAEVLLDGKPVGFTGEIHPDIIERLSLRSGAYISEFETLPLKDYLNMEETLKDVGKFPPNSRDISLVVDQAILSRNIMAVIESFHEWIQDVKYVDLFKGAQIGGNKKSVTFSITFQSRERTLTDAEVNEVMAKLVAVLKEKYSAELRE